MIKPPLYSDDPRHIEWVAEYKRTQPQKNYCWTATEKLVKAFPELRKVRGWAHYRYNLTWQADYECWDEHWWCETADGKIVDPTDGQWLDDRGGVVYGYEEYDTDVHGPDPIGKCMDCGDLIFPGGYDTWACSESCSASLRSYYNIR